MEKKITKKEYFAQIIKVLEEQGNTELVDFCEREVALLNKKAENKKSRGASAENAILAETVYNVLADNGTGMTVSEVQKSCDELSCLSTPKLTALMKILIDAGRVLRTADKKRTTFSAIIEEEYFDEEMEEDVE